MACSTRDSGDIGATLQHHEVFLRSHIFIIVGISSFRARGVDPCSRYQLLGKVVFADGVCTAVDTGSAVVNRKAARLCGRTASQLKAIVVDRFFETKREAVAWTNAHSEFMTLQIVPPGSRRDLSEP